LQISRRDLEEAQVAIEVSSNTVQTQMEALNRVRKQAQATSDSCRLDVMTAEEGRDRLAGRLEVEIGNRRLCEDKAGGCDQAVAEAESLRAEVRGGVVLCLGDR
jgi:hypothetical protein